MKKFLFILVMCFACGLCWGKTKVMHTGDSFCPPGPGIDYPITYLGWESKASLGIAEIFMINDSIAKVVLSQAKDQTIFYFKVGDKVYFYYYNGTCCHYALYKDANRTHYSIETYVITSLKNNEIQIEKVIDDGNGDKETEDTE